MMIIIDSIYSSQLSFTTIVTMITPSNGTSDNKRSTDDDTNIARSAQQNKSRVQEQPGIC